MTGTDPEAEATAALARGDHRAALGVLMRAYGDAVYRYCRTILADPDLADEVRQTVFVQAFRDLERFEKRASFRGWLFSIARHRCLDAARARHRRWRREAPGDPPESPDGAPGPDDRLASASIVGSLDRCLQALAPESRLAVVMRYQEGLSFDEMARFFRERPGTLQMRVARALPLLRRCLERGGVER